MSRGVSFRQLLPSLLFPSLTLVGQLHVRFTILDPRHATYHHPNPVNAA